MVVKHVNRTICGVPHEKLGAATATILRKKFPGRVFKTAVSIGYGNGFKEMQLIADGIVERFHLFELSTERVNQGTQLAKKRGLLDRVEFYNSDGLKRAQANKFDLVHWNNSLHHMLDVNEAVRWSHVALKSHGVFFMDDFVGPDRMQWSDKMLKFATRVRRALPEKYLQDPYRPQKKLPVRVKKPMRIVMLLKDPTECADSSRIVPCVKKWFPNVEVRPAGGTVYHLALNDVLHNIDETNDQALLEKLLRIDDMCTRLGEFHYATAVAEKFD